MNSVYTFWRSVTYPEGERKRQTIGVFAASADEAMDVIAKELADLREKSDESEPVMSSAPPWELVNEVRLDTPKVVAHYVNRATEL